MIGFGTFKGKVIICLGSKIVHPSADDPWIYILSGLQPLFADDICGLITDEVTKTRK